MKTEKRRIGDLGERIAANYLRRRFYLIVGRNLNIGHLELDIIARRGREMVFVEVKTRSVASLDDDMPYGPPSAAVNREKRLNLLHAAEAYMRAAPSGLIPRIDVIEVYLEKNAKRPKVLKINHYKNAVTRRNV